MSGSQSFGNLQKAVDQGFQDNDFFRGPFVHPIHQRIFDFPDVSDLRPPQLALQVDLVFRPMQGFRPVEVFFPLPQLPGPAARPGHEEVGLGIEGRDFQANGQARGRLGKFALDNRLLGQLPL